MIKHHRYIDFFPYPIFRKDQEQIIDQIEKSARQGKNILLVAPNGTGKTVMALSGLLPLAQDKGFKIVYLCRTHAQSSRVIQELIKIKNSLSGTGKTVAGISIRGRNNMCLNNVLLRLRASPSESMAVCADLRKNNNCVYYRKVKKINEGLKKFDMIEFNRPVDAEELIDYCKEHKYCPYFLTKYLLKEMTVVVCNYQWIFNPDIRFRFLKLLNTKLSKIILVIDECHNIVDVATSVNSYKLTPSMLTTCISDIQSLKMPIKFRQFASYIKNQLNQKKRDSSQGEIEVLPDAVLDSILKRLKLKTKTAFKKFLDELKASYESFDSKTKEKAGTSATQIPYLVKFWRNWLAKYLSEKYFFCYSVKSYNKRKSIALEIVSLDPRDITLSLFKGSYSCLNLTGTVNPYVFNNLTGLFYKFKNGSEGEFNSGVKGYTEILADSPFKSRNIKALIVSGINTSRDNRTPAMYKKIISSVLEVVNNTPGNVGVFCASYKILNSLRMHGINAAIKNKKLFVERPSLTASENAQLLKNFKDQSKKNGGVLLGVCGGRNSEGEDYPGDLMNAVIVVGLPYHFLSSQVKAKITYYDKVFSNQGWLFAYLYPAMQRANQASGRPIRKETDKGAIIFMDERFIKRVNWISDWVRKEIEVVSSLESPIKKFWN